MIEINNLVKKYGDHTAVDHLSLVVEPGKIYGFLGPNGAGKSTTPPVWNMLYILCASKNEAAASEAAVALMGKIGQIVRENSEKIFSIGPSDAPVAKISDVYRKVIYVKTREYQTLVILKDGLEAFIKDNRLYQNVAVGFDFNPVNGF